MSPCFRVFVLATFGTLITGCIAIPIPATEETVVFGSTVAEDEVRSKVAIGESELDVKARLGEPIVNFGPRKVFVYKWALRWGWHFWIYGPEDGVVPLFYSHLLFIAFDQDGKVLKTGTAKYKPFDSIAERVREWLSSNDLAAQVFGPRFGSPTSRGPTLFIYRPWKPPCSFPTFDSNMFKPSVAMDGIVVGDLRKGEYLGAEISAGSHEIAIDPIPSYEFAGQEENPYLRNVNKIRIPTTVQISVEPDQPSYIETYLCTGMGKIEMHAVIRDAPSALQGMRDLKPSW